MTKAETSRPYWDCSIVTLNWRCNVSSFICSESIRTPTKHFARIMVKWNMKLSLSTPRSHIWEGSRGITPPTHDLGARWRWVVNITPRPVHPREKVPVSILQETGWALEPVWTVLGKRKSLLPGFETRTVQHVSSRYTNYTFSRAVNVNIRCQVFTAMVAEVMVVTWSLYTVSSVVSFRRFERNVSSTFRLPEFSSGGC
jgi:hypothetical protein